MTETDYQEIAPEDPGQGKTLSHSKERRAFRKLRRELSDKEL